jgi:hypothetical protein
MRKSDAHNQENQAATATQAGRSYAEHAHDPPNRQNEMDQSTLAL